MAVTDAPVTSSVGPLASRLFLFIIFSLCQRTLRLSASLACRKLFPFEEFDESSPLEGCWDCRRGGGGCSGGVCC